ncbi:MAG: DNA-3-methyladenine glycosylase 2 [Cyclobacteriaceae bacterium]|nr:DNA-3-methyladenine glycosylase 2 [Cyclobacteriaceae bacterium]
MESFHIPVFDEFSFKRSVEFLQRSPKELLHFVDDYHVSKVIEIGSKRIVFELTQKKSNQLQVRVVSGLPLQQSEKAQLILFIKEWFDLDADLRPFYALVKDDKLLGPLVKEYFGYRIIGQPDLFESLVWAVLGQQINLQFAYTLKQRFVEQFGEKHTVGDKVYYLFPTPKVVSTLSDEHLLPLQFSRQKSKYVVLIAQAFLSGSISKEKLKDLPFQEAKEKLMNIKGVGNWTANYALMKTFRYPESFPLEDAGVHNAIKNLKKMKAKPTLEQVKRIFKKYKGWEAYATLYLWKSL